MELKDYAKYRKNPLLYFWHPQSGFVGGVITAIVIYVVVVLINILLHKLIIGA